MLIAMISDFRLPVRLLMLAGAVVCLFTDSTHAVNPGFIPGDAIFQSTLSEKLAKSFEPDSGSIKLRFDVLLETSTFGGDVGFHACVITRMPAEEIRRLKDLYTELRKDIFHSRQVVEDVQKDGSLQLRELNPFHLLVCSQDFDPQKYLLGLRYNEDWMQPIKLPRFLESGTTEHPGVHRSLLRGEEFIMQDWRDAKAVPGLKHTFPPGTKWNVAAPNLEIQVEFSAADVALYILDDDELVRFARHEDGATCYRLDTESLRELKWASPDEGGEVRFTSTELLLGGK